MHAPHPLSPSAAGGEGGEGEKAQGSGGGLGDGDDDGVVLDGDFELLACRFIGKGDGERVGQDGVGGDVVEEDDGVGEVVDIVHIDGDVDGVIAEEGGAIEVEGGAGGEDEAAAVEGKGAGLGIALHFDGTALQRDGRDEGGLV